MNMYKRSYEQGNALFLILIAVALFAALSYAVTNSTRSGGGVSSLTETELIKTSVIAQRGAQIKTAIDRMKIIHGVQNWEICFDHANWGHNNYNYSSCNNVETNIFNSEGGGVAFGTPDSDWLDTANSGRPRYGQYVFQSRRVEGIGTDSGSGGSMNDLVMYLPHLKKDVCVKINEGLGITNPSGDPPTEPNETNPKYFQCTFGESGSHCYGSSIQTAIDGTGDELVGKEAGCARFTNAFGGATSYTFYQVLVAR